MKSSLFSLLKKSTQPHSIPFLSSFEEKVRSSLSPFDWLIIFILGVIMAFGVAVMLTTVSLNLSVEVPARGGVHTEGVIGNPRFINPLLAISETDNDLTELVFSGLLHANPDGSLVPDIAKSFEATPDGLSYTFYLDENATFHDGTPVTAEDVVFTVQAAKNPEIKSPRRANWEGVEVTALEEHVVVFNLKAPYALFLENTTMGILPKHLWEQVRPEEFPFSELNTNPVGEGPYKIQSIKKNSSGVPTEYRLSRFENAINPGYIKTFKFRFYPNQEALFEAYKKGEIEAAHSIIPDNTRGGVLREAVFGRVFGIFFNQNQQELFTDIVVRRALNEAVDKDELVSTILSGYGTPLSEPLPPESVSREASLEATDRETHIENARTVLENNGWKKGEDGIYMLETKDATKRLSFSLSTGNASELKQAAEYVAEAWREVGAEVNLAFFDQNDLNLEVIRPRDYDALLFGLVVGRELDLFAFWHASQRNDPGLNIALYANISTDALLEEARREADPVLRRAKAEEAAAEIAEEYAAVFLYAPHFLYLTEKNLRGVVLGTVSTPSDRFSNVRKWYLKTERVWPFFAY